MPRVYRVDNCKENINRWHRIKPQAAKAMGSVTATAARAAVG